MPIKIFHLAARVTLLALILSEWASASDASKTNLPPQLKITGHRLSQDMSKWDGNQNGRLDPQEMEAYRKDRAKERIAQQEARAKAIGEARKMDEAARRTRMVPPTLVKQYDTNTNNLIDLNEWQLYRQDVARQTEQKRAARLATATNSPVPPSVISTNSPSPSSEKPE